MKYKKYTLYVVCAESKCPEPVKVDKFDKKPHYCEKCSKKKARQAAKSR